jgi:aryl-alcohol dehydrogenase-like predicted oxidoreductase
VGLQIEYSPLARDAERELTPMARDQSMTVLAWLLHRPQPVIPIMGARTLDQFRRNLAAVDVALTAARADSTTAS